MIHAAYKVMESMLSQGPESDTIGRATTLVTGLWKDGPTLR